MRAATSFPSFQITSFDEAVALYHQEKQSRTHNDTVLLPPTMTFLVQAIVMICQYFRYSFQNSFNYRWLFPHVSSRPRYEI